MGKTISEKNILFFDLDGTLTNPAKGITNSFVYALKKMGMEVPAYDVLLTFIGPPLIETFQTRFGLSEERAMEGMKFYREYFGETGLFENEVYPGIDSLLKSLKENGKKLFIATSKPEIYSVRIAQRFGFEKYFEKICGSNLDESRSKKSEVIKYALDEAKAGEGEKDNVLMIGDREHDIFGAKENNINSCGVLFGYGTKAELENAGATYIAESVEHLQKLLLG